MGKFIDIELVGAAMEAIYSQGGAQQQGLLLFVDQTY